MPRPDPLAPLARRPLLCVEWRNAVPSASARMAAVRWGHVRVYRSQRHRLWFAALTPVGVAASRFRGTAL